MSDLIAAEWTKIRSVRSTYAAIAGAAAIAVIVAVVVGRADVTHWDQSPAADRAHFDPVSMSMDGFTIAQLVMATLGVLVITSEYGTGLIRTTFAAAPAGRGSRQRRPWCPVRSR